MHKTLKDTTHKLYQEITENLFISFQDTKPLKSLLQKMTIAVKQTIKALEKQRMEPQTLCQDIPTAGAAKNTQSSQKFSIYLAKLDKLHKFVLNLKPGASPRLQAKVSHDLDLGMRVVTKMKKHIINVDKSTSKDGTFTSKCSKTHSAASRKSLRHHFLKRYRDLLKISQSLIDQRFSNTE